MTQRVDAGERALEAARQLQAAAEYTRAVLRTSGDLIRRSRAQTERIAAAPVDARAVRPDDRGPPKELVACLIQAFELCEDDSDAHTRALLGRVLHHVGCRVAAAIGYKASGRLLN